MKNAKLFCQYCDLEGDIEYKRENITSNINGESIIIELDIPYCKSCGAELSDNDLEDYRYDLLYRAYREKRGLLHPEEIKELRVKYELSQRAFSRVLGFAESTINRYELGAIQDNTNNALIKLSSNPENMLLLLEQNKKNLSNTEALKLKSRIELLINEEKDNSDSIENELKAIIEKVTRNERKLDLMNRKIDAITRKMETTSKDNEKYGVTYSTRRSNKSAWEISYS